MPGTSARRSSRFSASHQNFELIIVDDHSQDDSVAVIQSFSDPRITLLVNETNLGTSAASIRAKPLCKGKYFCSLDSDDYFAPDKLEQQVRHLEANSGAGLVATHVTEVNDQGRPPAAAMHEDWFNQPVDFNRPGNWIWKNRLCHSSVMLRREIYDRLWDYDSGLRLSTDWYNWIRLLAHGVCFAVLPERLTCYRHHGTNVTHKNPERSFWEYAFISARVFHTFLERNGQPDLILENLKGFLCHPSFPQAPMSQVNLLALLLHDAASGAGFDAIWESRAVPLAGSDHPLPLGSAIDTELRIVEAMRGAVVELERRCSELARERAAWQEVAEDREWLIRVTVLPRLLRFLRLAIRRQ